MQLLQEKDKPGCMAAGLVCPSLDDESQPTMSDACRVQNATSDSSRFHRQLAD